MTALRLRDDRPEDVAERRRTHFLQLVADVPGRVPGPNEPSEVDRSSRDDDVALRGVDRGLELSELLVVVAHGRQDVRELRPPRERLGDGADGERPGIDDLRRSRLARRYEPCT